MKTNTEFLRLVNNEPLVLAVSALSDFLWDDFIRDARPIVKYLEDKYNIKQLSRFGKELFDFLYNGGQVTTVIRFCCGIQEGRSLEFLSCLLAVSK